MQCLLKCDANKSLAIVSPPYESALASKSTPKQLKHDKRSKQREVDKMSGRTRSKSTQQKDSQMGTLEDMAESNFIEPDVFLKSDQETRLLTIITGINKIHHRFDKLEQEFSKENGVLPRLTKVESAVEEVSSEGCKYKSELDILKGVVQRQEEQIGALTSQILDVKSRMMSEHLIMSGIVEHPPPSADHDQSGSYAQAAANHEETKDECVKKILDVLETHLGLIAKNQDIFQVYRMGEPY